MFSKHKRASESLLRIEGLRNCHSRPSKDFLLIEGLQKIISFQRILDGLLSIGEVQNEFES